MPGLAASIRNRGAKPGSWIRPLRAGSTAARNLLLPAARFAKHNNSPAYDPTVQEALALVEDAVRKPVQWGYELIKHDFSTWELFGRWGAKRIGARCDGDVKIAKQRRLRTSPPHDDDYGSKLTLLLGRSQEKFLLSANGTY